MQRYTVSRAAAFRRCQQEHQFQYEDLRRPRRTPGALSFGRLMHAGVEQWRLAIKEGRDEPQCLALALAGIAAVVAGLDPETDEIDDFEVVKAEELMAGYHCRWFEHDTTELRYLEVEREFETPMINPETGYPSRTWVLSGKIDGIAEVAGRVWNVETKTTSADISPGSDYWGRLRIDGQVSQYYRGAEALGFELWGCIYDVIKKPTIKPMKATPEEDRKYTTKASKLRDGTVRPAGSLYANMRENDETPDEFRERLRASILSDPNAYYQRGDVVRLNDDLERYQLDTWRTAKMIRDVQLQGGPARNPDSCVRYGRFCSYWAVCTGTADISDPALFRDSERHPELSAEKAAS